MDKLGTRSQIRTRIATIVGVAGLVVAVSQGLAILPSVPAGAVTVPSSATDPNFCSDYGRAVGGTFDGVEACTPTGSGSVAFIGNGGKTVYSESSPYGFQCVELSVRYLYTLGYGVIGENGVALVPNYASTYGIPMATSAAGSPMTAGDAIQEGDVISMSVSTTDTVGHTAIVTRVTGTPSSGTITILSENAPSVFTLGVSNGLINTGGTGTSGVFTNLSGEAFSRFSWLELGNRGASESVIHTAAALIPNDGASGYVLDGYGGIHPFGNAPAVTAPATWPGWDIARGIAVTAPGKGYVLDGYGGVHPFGGAPGLADPSYWSGWDIARGIALCRGGAGGYVLDGYGGIHAIGNAPTVTPLGPNGTDPWNWDIARGIVVDSTCTGGYVLDGYGGIHAFGNAPAVSGSAYWGGWDIARSITLVTDSSGYVLDGYGGLHTFAAAGTPTPPAPSGTGYAGGSDIYRAFVIDPEGGTGAQVSAYQLQANGTVVAGQVNIATEPLIHTAAALIPNDGASGYVLDGYGGIHPFGNAPAVTATATWPGWDIARGIAVTAPGKGYVLDGYGGVHPFGGAPGLADPSYWSGWDIARGIALCRGGAGGYVLDGYGGIHAIGNAPTVTPLGPNGTDPWNWDIARGIVVDSTCTGGYVLDGYGGIHAFGNAPAVSGSAYWGGWDIARSITLVTDSSGYVLDGYGGLHTFAAAGTPTPPAQSNAGFDSAATDPFDAYVYISRVKSGVAITRSYSNGLFWMDATGPG